MSDRADENRRIFAEADETFCRFCYLKCPCPGQLYHNFNKNLPPHLTNEEKGAVVFDRYVDFLEPIINLHEEDNVVHIDYCVLKPLINEFPFHCDECMCTPCVVYDERQADIIYEAAARKAEGRLHNEIRQFLCRQLCFRAVHRYKAEIKEGIENRTKFPRCIADYMNHQYPCVPGQGPVSPRNNKAMNRSFIW